MKDKEYDAVVKDISKYVNKWITILGLTRHTIKLEYTREWPEDGTTAVCNPLWQYNVALITFYPPAMEGYSSERIEETVVHELVHIMVHALTPDNPSDDTKKLVEKTVTDLAYSFTYAYLDGLNTTKPVK